MQDIKKIIETELYIKGKTAITIPELQQKFALDYKEAKEIFDTYVSKGVLSLGTGIEYTVLENGHDDDEATKPECDDWLEKRKEELERRRQELIKKLSSETDSVDDAGREEAEKFREKYEEFKKHRQEVIEKRFAAEEAAAKRTEAEELKKQHEEFKKRMREDNGGVVIEEKDEDDDDDDVFSDYVKLIKTFDDAKKEDDDDVDEDDDEDDGNDNLFAFGDPDDDDEDDDDDDEDEDYDYDEDDDDDEDDEDEDDDDGDYSDDWEYDDDLPPRIRDVGKKAGDGIVVRKFFGCYFIAPPNLRFDCEKVWFKILDKGDRIYLTDDNMGISYFEMNHFGAGRKELTRKIQAVADNYGMSIANGELQIRLPSPEETVTCMMKLYAAMEQIALLVNEMMQQNCEDDDPDCDEENEDYGEDRGEDEEEEDADEDYDEEDESDYEEDDDCEEDEPTRYSKALCIKALKCVIDYGRPTIVLLQRKLGINYFTAGKILDWMEMMGYISKYDRHEGRRVLMTKEQFNKKYGNL